MVQSLLSNANMGGFAPFVQYPGDDCCMLFADNNFGRNGERESDQDIDLYRKTICHTGERTIINLFESNWANKVDSYICGKNVWYDFCNDSTTILWENSECFNSNHGVHGAGHIKNSRIYHNGNQMSSAVLGPYNAHEDGAVTLFEDSNCAGASGRFYWDRSSPASGTMYSYEDLYFAGTRGNTMNSIAVPAGYIAEVYENDGFTGRVQVIRGAYKDSSEEMVCVASTFNDAVSSVIIKR